MPIKPTSRTINYSVNKVNFMRIFHINIILTLTLIHKNNYKLRKSMMKKLN